VKIEETVRQDVLCPDAAPAIRATGQKQRGQVETETVAGQAVPIQTLDRGAIEFRQSCGQSSGRSCPGECRMLPPKRSLSVGLRTWRKAPFRRARKLSSASRPSPDPGTPKPRCRRRRD